MADTHPQTSKIINFYDPYFSLLLLFIFFYLEKCQFICTSSYQKFLKIHTDCFAVIWNAVFAHVAVFELSNNH